MKKIPYFLFFIILAAFIVYIYNNYFSTNVLINTNVKDAQVRYKIYTGEMKSFIKELSDSKSYSVLGRTPLNVDLEKGKYVIIVSKSGHVPVISELEIGDEKVEKSIFLAEGFRFVDSKKIKYNNKNIKTNAFFMSETEVTNRDYLRFCEATSHRFPLYIEDPRFNGQDQPVIGIDYEDAIAFTQWKSEVTGLKIRLPYEREWIAAASNGDSTRVYPWGVHETTTSSYLANYHPFDMIQRKLLKKDVDGFEYTSPVGSFPRTDKKFFDLGGNVFEWCLDSLSLLTYTDFNLDPTIVKFSRIVKGGSWNFNQNMMRIDNRVYVDGRIAKGYNGIRLLVEID